MIFLSKHISSYALGRLKWILDIFWPLNQHFNLKNQRNWRTTFFMLRFLIGIICILLHRPKKLTLVNLKNMGLNIYKTSRYNRSHYECPNLSSWPKFAILYWLNDVQACFDYFLPTFLLYPMFFDNYRPIFWDIFWPLINSKCPKRKVEGCIIKLPIASLNGILIISWIHSRFRCVDAEP